MIRPTHHNDLSLMPNQPPKTPQDPPDEPLIIKIPPRHIRLPDQDPQKPSEVPELDLPEDELWRRPEMPPPPPPWSEDWVALKDDDPRVVAM